MLVQEQNAYLNFVNSIKSDVTKKIYEYILKLFMEFRGTDKFEDLIGQQHQDNNSICCIFLRKY